MKLGYVGGVLLVLLVLAGVLAYSALFAVPQTHQALVLRFGNPVRVISEPGLNYKVPFMDNVVYVDKRILDLENPAQEMIASDQKRLVVDAFARYKITDPLRYYQTLGSLAGRQFPARHAAQRGPSPRARRGDLHPCRARRSFGADGPHPRSARPRRAGLRHCRGRRAHPPSRSAGAEQPGGLSAHADRTPTRGRGIPRARRAARAGNPLPRGPRRHRRWSPTRPRRAEQIRGEGDGERNRIFADAFNRDVDFFAFYRSMQAYEAGLKHNDTRMLLKPDSEFFRYFVDPSGKREGATAR